MYFERYERPETVQEASALLREERESRILAGGTDLVPRLKSGAWKTKMVVDLSRLEELQGVRYTKRGLELGAMVRLAALQEERSLQGAHRLLGECAGHVSSIQVRNMATIGGNSCNASPSADTAPAMLLFNASACIRRGDTEYLLPMDEFYMGAGRTALEQGDILLRFVIPKQPEHTGAAYYKYSIRGDSDISIVGAGAKLVLEEGRIQEARLAFASVSAKTIRIQEAERMLLGQEPTKELFQEAAVLCAGLCAPITDQRASESYRRKMTKVFAEKALASAFRRISGI